ncbi:zinc finger, CCHC-type containing protein, partial [Tanacetum coccineum]
KYFVPFIDDASRFCYVYLLHTKDEALDKFKVFKTEVELQQGSLIKRFKTDMEGEYMDTLYFQSVGLSQGFWGEAILPDPKLKTLGERGIKCIFVGYAEHSKAFRLYAIGPNDLVLINSMIESRDAIFDENRLSSVPRPILRIHNETEDIGGSVVPEDVVQQLEPELRKSKRKAINDDMDSIMGNNTWVLADLPPDFKVDFGPTPFRFFHSWLELDGFNDLVVQTWAHDGIVEASGFISFKKKLQNLKRVIRDWVISKKADSNKLKREHQARLAAIDTKVDQGCANEEDFINHRDSTKNLDDILSMESKDLAKKLKSNGLLKATRILIFFMLAIVRNKNLYLLNAEGRNILDGPLILNEVIAWYRKRKKELMVFKVDFEKAFDSLRIIRSLKPRTAIMRVLHMLTHKAEAMGIFKGVTFGNDNMRISHLIYADDVIFIGDWSYSNAHNLLCMLRCFYLISGLKINVNKSNILGVGVPEVIVSNMAYSIGCGGGDIDERKMSWVRWNKCLASKDLGGLRIGSIFGLNTGLLFKWIWRFLYSPSTLWVRVIKSILGPHGCINDNSPCRLSSLGKCGDQPLKTLFPRIYMLDSDRSCLVMNRIPFYDVNSFLRRQPRRGIEMAQLSELQAKIEHVTLSDHGDSWLWTLDSFGFSISSVQYLVDSETLDTATNATRWIRHIPIKVNIFIWRLMLNKLPSRVNLDRRARWWDLDIPIFANIFEWLDWIGTSQLLNRVKDYLEGVGGTLMWSIWSFRNRLIFSNTPPIKAVLWDFIVSQSYLWISSRNPKSKISWARVVILLACTVFGTARVIGNDLPCLLWSCPNLVLQLVCQLKYSMDTSEKLMPNNGQAVSQLEYSRVVGFLMYAMTCTRSDIAFVVGKLSRLTYTGYPSVLEGYTDASWISNTEDNSSISGWVFLLGGGVISWASKKQTCITGSAMESEFVALAAAGKEAKWLKNLFFEIPLWSKPIAPMSIRCDSAATLANACSQMYNRKSRHLGVRHSMIRKLITNGVIYIEFVRSQQNLADHLTKGLTKDLVIKSAEGMGLKSN